MVHRAEKNETKEKKHRAPQHAALHHRKRKPLHTKPLHTRRHKTSAFTVLGLVLGLVLVFAIVAGPGAGPGAGQDNERGTGSLDFDLYVMSQCPYGTKVEQELVPVLENLGSEVNFRLHFIGNVFTAEQYASAHPQVQSMCYPESDGMYYCSLHGESETKGAFVQLCVQEHEPEKLPAMLSCMNENPAAIPGNWEACAKDTGMSDISVQTIKKCYEGPESKELFAASVAGAEAAGAQGSPTMKLNDEDFTARDEISIMRAFCNSIEGNENCDTLPECVTDFDCTAEPDKVGLCQNPATEDAQCTYTEPVPLRVTVLNAEECGSSCDTTQLESVTKQLFKGATFAYADISSQEGEKLVEELELTVVPVLVFEGNLEETYMWKLNPQLRSAFARIGDRYRLLDQAAGATYFISDEVRAEHFARISVTLGDNRPQIDFYVMSYCPYGNQAEELIEGVFDRLGAVADFNPHYVIYGNYQGGGPDYCFDEESRYCSLHGIVELNQDVRELCVDKYMGTRAWFGFATAMNKQCNQNNADTCWEGVARELGLDVGKINDCFENEALDLLRREKELNELLGVQGSPTVFVEGRQYGGSRSVGGYGVALCSGFDARPSVCDTFTDEPAPQQQTVPAGYGACGA